MIPTLVPVFQVQVHNSRNLDALADNTCCTDLTCSRKENLQVQRPPGKLDPQVPFILCMLKQGRGLISQKHTLDILPLMLQSHCRRYCKYRHRPKATIK